MTITIAEVIEQAAQECDICAEQARCCGSNYALLVVLAAKELAEKIRALAAQYEGCIVAEGDGHYHYDIARTLYRAREPQS